MRKFSTYMLNQPIDISREFGKFDNTYFNASEVISFNTKTGVGRIMYNRYLRKYRNSFNCVTAPFERATSWEFPPEYKVDEDMEFKIDFITDKTIRIRFDCAGDGVFREDEKLMIEKDILQSKGWTYEEKIFTKEILTKMSTKDMYENKKICTNVVEYKSESIKVILYKNPFNIEIQDLDGNTITKTYNIADSTALDNTDPTAFSYVRRVSDMKKSMVASFKLRYDEKIYGCGESFTRLNKRGQKINLWTYDALGSQSQDMYKPIPFFISSAGYGMFMHTSSAMTFDFGYEYDEASSLYVDDDILDLFIFVGEPKTIVQEYTSLTGRATMPPDWSFGLWLSRITYDNEEQVRNVAKNLKKHKIPCDVIHLDTGWFEKDWQCNYKFSSQRFKDAPKMISELKEMGYRISLWQIPYITPTNELYKEAMENGYYVKNIDGKRPTEDVIIDFSNKDAVAWYKELLKSVLDMGISAIKVDFGEGAPFKGQYASGKSGRYEHNLYPLRYNKAAYEITKDTTGEGIIWARSTWAGSQRYPVHWGGDAEITDSAMAGTLRGLLSLGLCGFTFSSHDIGGFTKTSPKDLYNRWCAFGMLSSHSRCHGNPPKEPWEYGKKFMDSFRKSVEMKYMLMPYIKQQSIKSIENGYPLMRTLFFEFPKDETSWFIEDEYMFGESLLVAPLMEEGKYTRKVYLPKGIWVNYFTKEELNGGYHIISATDIPIILMVLKGHSIEHTELALCTNDIDFNKNYTITY